MDFINNGQILKRYLGCGPNRWQWGIYLQCSHRASVTAEPVKSSSLHRVVVKPINPCQGLQLSVLIHLLHLPLTTPSLNSSLTTLSRSRAALIYFPSTVGPSYLLISATPQASLDLSLSPNTVLSIKNTGCLRHIRFQPSYLLSWLVSHYFYMYLSTYTVKEFFLW